jgi:hypothetical protein
MTERDAEREQGCTGRTDKMTGVVKKSDAQGFGIIDGADGSKVPFTILPYGKKNSSWSLP